jgi:hypothetical protein
MEGRLDFGALMRQRIGLPDDLAEAPATMPTSSPEVD